ncbi:O-antigen ligase family protein [Burkholderia sp. TSV86]|uniref:O-antigen ligase family protein n=1 Tax=Burkholderia sp. TSV86 TaxID=1385594 RepID=UPI00075A07D5|nr:O-antigen ligase family protein [Burkholderia sp. TSV86]KVE39225.1 polymerase [Burkholderia sp. TSV86]
MKLAPHDASWRLTAARVCAVAALCSVPLSTALTNIMCALFVLTLVSSPEFWRRLPSLPRHRSALAALLLFAALTASVAYSVAPQQEAWSWVGKYVKLLALPLAVIAFKDSGWQKIACWSLFVTLITVTVLSTTNYLGLTAIGPAHIAGEPLSRAWVFKNHIAAGMLGALLFYQAADFALAAGSRRARAIFAAIALLTLVNVLVMLQGRTGQIVAILFVFAIAARYALQHRDALRPRPLLLGIGIAAAAAAAIVVACTVPGERMMKVVSEVREYRESNAVTSTGLRVEWYRKSLELIEARPVIGYGAGGLGTEFEKLTAGKTGAQGELTHNPHNEYLLMAVQLGVIGTALFVYLLARIGRDAATLEPRSRHLLLAWLFAFALGCLANSMLLDFTEGHLLTLLAGILLGCGWRDQAAGDRDTVTAGTPASAPPRQ